MSYFTPADAEYIKDSIEKIRDLAHEHGRMRAEKDCSATELCAECDAEQARVEAFIDGCTLEKGKGG